ncbi:hypothetical protein Tco_0758810 [Tanacetum coccineum]
MFKFGTYTAGIDDDEVPTKEVSPELLAEVFEKEMTYDDIQIIYMENENVCESREEDLTEKIPKKPVLVYLSCAINPKIPPISLVNQDLFYLKWVKNTIKGFNLYARYVVDHWKSLWAQQDHIRRKQKKRDNPDKLHFDVKIAEVVRVQFDQVGLIYENSKKEKRVMVIKEILKFCYATLKRVLEKVKKFNMDVKHGYADPNLSDEDAEYMEFYEEYIKERLKHQNQMRR